MSLIERTIVDLLTRVNELRADAQLISAGVLKDLEYYLSLTTDEQNEELAEYADDLQSAIEYANNGTKKRV